MDERVEVAAGAEGFRWPAEWERHEATWLSWPHNAETWPDCLPAAEDAFVAMVRALLPSEAVRINVADEFMGARVRARLRKGEVDADRVELHWNPTNDAWVRDHGPIFVVRPGEKAVLDFGFDAWGGKYPPWDLDDAVPARTAANLGLRHFTPGFVLEGGSIDGDGAGTVLTTETCLLDPARARPGEAPRTREEMERRLAAWLGARHVVWLAGEIEGDDTDGHVDDLARFIAPGRVVTSAAPPTHPDFPALEENRKRLAAARDAAGRPFDVVELPVPPLLRSFGGETCPATYVNFYLANDVALVPVFDAPEDARALAVLREVLEPRDVVPIPASDLVVGLGAVHCLTQQEPALPAPAVGSGAAIG